MSEIYLRASEETVDESLTGLPAAAVMSQLCVLCFDRSADGETADVDDGI